MHEPAGSGRQVFPLGVFFLNFDKSLKVHGLIFFSIWKPIIHPFILSKYSADLFVLFLGSSLLCIVRPLFFGSFGKLFKYWFSVLGAAAGRRIKGGSYPGI
jgi:hypothetical protein